MGLKFKGKFTTGAPTGGDLGIRELALNTADGIIYTSTTGADIVQLTSDRGVIYNADTQYKTGDVVTIGDKIYVIGGTPPAAGTSPNAANSIEFSPERGGIAFDAATTYVTGDVVVEAGVAYFSIAGSAAHAFAPTEWTQVSMPEKGGKIYNATTIYDIGDEVTLNGKSYIALTSGSNALPGNNVIENGDWTNDIIVDPGSYS